MSSFARLLSAAAASLLGGPQFLSEPVSSPSTVERQPGGWLGPGQGFLRLILGPHPRKPR
jgi:hypothetical protein